MNVPCCFFLATVIHYRKGVPTHTHTHTHTHIYIYIYILRPPVKSIWPPLNYFMFHPKSVILMKQVKHHKSFIYYFKYKSSIKSKLNKYMHAKNFWFQKCSSLADITGLHIFGILSTKDYRYIECISAELSCKRCQNRAAHMRCLALTFRSSSSHTSSTGLKSLNCVTQDILWRTRCSSLLLMFLWQSLLEWFGSLSSRSTNPWATSWILDWIAWCCSMLWQQVWFN